MLYIIIITDFIHRGNNEHKEEEDEHRHESG